ncbi:uncharacterized protein N7496_006313 [Penicillium cataractarum]|uniref:Uncharacterized protein n=1 Tax=Penicillium cataractarum TaxID=2100454 RepID=A0A9W9S1H5_9EURO|nr:uncharacterized protein N7496_006313 [Penicillium cataractarum]KAJ5370221.1 hypothetical protein N7496_006313 [Penicillium cataractarum]
MTTNPNRPEIQSQLLPGQHFTDILAVPTSRCNRYGRCIYEYPQPINHQTYMDDLSRVRYCRCNQEDRWVTPHIPALVHLIDCHIYVDVCSTATIFLYPFKDPFKGLDRVCFGVRALHDTHTDALLDEVDEFTDHVNARYLSLSEAVYRIFKFNTVYKRPSVRCLTVHLKERT